MWADRNIDQGEVLQVIKNDMFQALKTQVLPRLHI